MGSEAMETWLRRVGSKAAMRHRQEARLSGALNQPMRRRQSVSGKNPHRLECLCVDCVPFGMAEDLREIMDGRMEGRVPR